MASQQIVELIDYTNDCIAREINFMRSVCFSWSVSCISSINKKVLTWRKIVASTSQALSLFYIILWWWIFLTLLLTNLCIEFIFWNSALSIKTLIYKDDIFLVKAGIPVFGVHLKKFFWYFLEQIKIQKSCLQTLWNKLLKISLYIV